MALTLTWIKCEGDVWCPLLTVNLNNSNFDDMEGVYIIWHSGDKPATVRVGQGFIRDRLAQHKEDSQILAYQQYGLYVTWARLDKTNRDGVERYLGETLKPKIGSRLPDVPPIAVNLPWKD